VEVCLQEVSRLDGIIKNFLKALRPARANLEEINPLAPLAETLKFLQNELQDLKISVEINTENSLPSIMGDTNLLKQLYFNLIKNAMEAMDLGGVIKISTGFDDNFVKISISDTGCGIDQDEITRIFEPYFTTKTDGHGLGMMIASEIVKSHGGTIGIDSRKGEGTRIRLLFPRKDKRIREITAE
ncbi:MAG: GHKL domain-containing protein, partial [Opitutales bacterium]|nr:GHKL domain-containing protein [Opitutales bacterium]